MKIKNQVFTLLATTLAASTPMLDASISGVERETAINGDIAITVVHTPIGQIIAQVSDDGGLNWSQPTLLNEGNSSGILPVVAVGASSAACLYLTTGNIAPPVLFSYYTYLAGGTVTRQSGAWGGPSGTWGITTALQGVEYGTPQGLDFAGTGNDVLLLIVPPTQNKRDLLFLSNFFSPNFSTLPKSVEVYSPKAPFPGRYDNPNPGANTIMPVLFAANGLTALAIVPQYAAFTPEPNSTFPLSQLFHSGPSPEDAWNIGPSAEITGLTQRNPLLPPASQIQLATSEEISQASLVWLGADSHLYTSQLNPITDGQWSTPVPLSMDLTSIGGLNFDEASNTLQVLARNNSGQLIHATGTSDAITNATIVGSHINQISNSQINGATGLWLVLDNNKTLSLWQASPQGLTSMTIAQKLTSVIDHNTSLSIASDKSTGVVLLVFDIASASAQFPGHPDLTGPGTYLFRSEGYPLDFTAQRLAN